MPAVSQSICVSWILGKDSHMQGTEKVIFFFLIDLVLIFLRREESRCLVCFTPFFKCASYSVIVWSQYHAFSFLLINFRCHRLHDCPYTEVRHCYSQWRKCHCSAGTVISLLSPWNYLRGFFFLGIHKIDLIYTFCDIRYFFILNRSSGFYIIKQMITMDWITWGRNCFIKDLSLK